MLKLIVLIGIQASGKSTFFRTHFADTFSYVSKDLLRNNRRPARRQALLIEEALQTNRSVVVDNTNASPEERASIIAIGQRYEAQLVGYYFEVQVDRSIARNTLRMGKERVPPIAIFATLKRLVRPSYSEGFHALYYVRPMDDFTFEIADWLDERTHPNG